MKASIKILTILICYAISFWYLFNSHYQYQGDVACMRYYTPFDMSDYFFAALMTITAIASTYFFVLRNSRKRILSTAFCVIFYASVTLACIAYHINILEYPTEYWPHYYHPMPLENMN